MRQTAEQLSGSVESLSEYAPAGFNETFLEKIEEKLLEQTDNTELERMLNEVENLSNEEAKKIAEN